MRLLVFLTVLTLFITSIKTFNCFAEEERESVATVALVVGHGTLADRGDAKMDDKIFPNDKIVVDPGGLIQLRLQNGATLDLPEGDHHLALSTDPSNNITNLILTSDQKDTNNHINNPGTKTDIYPVSGKGNERLPTDGAKSSDAAVSKGNSESKSASPACTGFSCRDIVKIGYTGGNPNVVPILPMMHKELVVGIYNNGALNPVVIQNSPNLGESIAPPSSNTSIVGQTKINVPTNIYSKSLELNSIPKIPDSSELSIKIKDQTPLYKQNFNQKQIEYLQNK